MRHYAAPVKLFPFVTTLLLAALAGCAAPDHRREATVENLQAAVKTYLDRNALQDCYKLMTFDEIPTRLIKSQLEASTVQKLRTLAAAGLVTLRDDTGPLGPVLAVDFTPAGRTALQGGQVCFGPLKLVSVDAVEKVGKIGDQDAVRVKTHVVPAQLPAWARSAEVREALGLILDPAAPRARTFAGVLTQEGWIVQPS